MEIKHKKIPDKFLENLPEGMKLLTRNSLNFLVVDRIYCPNGHSLIEPGIMIHEVPAISLKISDGFNSGYIFLDSFWGSHAKLYSFIPKHTDSLEDFKVSCPACDTSLMIERDCEEDSCSSNKAVQLTLPGNNKIFSCARLGCPGHSLEVKVLPVQIRQCINEINYFLEDLELNDIFKGV